MRAPRRLVIVVVVVVALAPLARRFRRRAPTVHIATPA
jgi:hypothetical protein